MLRHKCSYLCRVRKSINWTNLHPCKSSQSLKSLLSSWAYKGFEEYSNSMRKCWPLFKSENCRCVAIQYLQFRVNTSATITRRRASARNFPTKPKGFPLETSKFYFGIFQLVELPLYMQFSVVSVVTYNTYAGTEHLRISVSQSSSLPELALEIFLSVIKTL